MKFQIETEEQMWRWGGLVILQAPCKITNPPHHSQISASVSIQDPEKDKGKGKDDEICEQFDQIRYKLLHLKFEAQFLIQHWKQLIVFEGACFFFSLQKLPSFKNCSFYNRVSKSSWLIPIACWKIFNSNVHSTGLTATCPSLCNLS